MVGYIKFWWYYNKKSTTPSALFFFAVIFLLPYFFIGFFYHDLSEAFKRYKIEREQFYEEYKKSLEEKQ